MGRAHDWTLYVVHDETTTAESKNEHGLIELATDD
jgi:hypothetical protein